MRDAQSNGNNSEMILDKETEVLAQLKWFNRPKGFGFVIYDETEINAFIHITTLQDARIDALGDDARLRCVVIESDKGPHVKEVVELIDEGNDPKPLKSETAINEAEGGDPFSLSGSVKWYKPDKGFGFITGDDGEKDVFIHQTCLEKHGLTSLSPGVRVVMMVKIVPKGREVVSFELEE